MYARSSTPQSIGQVLDAGFQLYRQVFVGLVPFGFLLGIATVLLYAAFSQERIEALLVAGEADAWIALGIGSSVYMLVIAIVFAAMQHYCAIAAEEGRGSIADSLGIAFRKTFVIVFAMIFYVIAVIGGSLLLVIPGIIVAISMFFYTLRIVLDDEGPVRCLTASHKLVWGNWWRTLMVLTVAGIIYFVVYLALIIPLSLVDEFLLQSEMAIGPFEMLGELIVYTLASPYFVAAIVALYHDLRVRKEGGDLEERLAGIAPGD